jgi:primosomal protein N' (replication factor Y)
LEGQVAPGSLLAVPFGSQTVQGVALRFMETARVAETRPVKDLIDPAAVLTPAQIELARRMAEESLAPLADCVALMLPPGLARRAEIEYTRVEAGPSPSDDRRSPLQKRLLDLLKKRSPLRAGQIDAALPNQDWRAAAKSLIRQGALTARSILPPPRVQPKMARNAQLAVPPEQAEALMNRLGRQDSDALRRRQAMLRFLIREAAPVEAAWLYAEAGGGNSRDLQALEEQGLAVLGESEVWRDPLAGLGPLPSIVRPELTPAQSEAWSKICPLIEAAAHGRPVAPILLHGVTGSGKTEIYLRAVERTLELGRQALVLVPEIALTPQTVRRFAVRFPGRTGLLHSALSDGERYDTWRRARLGLLPVMVGARSAAFAPLAHLGLIVVDECHDDSYYQSENPPYYHAREVAVEMARLAGAVCLLGSATPDLTSYVRAGRGGVSPPVQPNVPGADMVPASIQSNTGRGGVSPPVQPNVPGADMVPAPIQSNAGGDVGTTPSLPSIDPGRGDPAPTRPNAAPGGGVSLPGPGGYEYIHLPDRILAHRESVQVQLARLRPGEVPTAIRKLRFAPLTEQADSAGLPPVRVVDLREELKAGVRSLFSRDLQAALAETFSRGEQAILFLNRRGAATYVFCRDCGVTINCPRCDLPLTFHQAWTPKDTLVCHHCGYTRRMPPKCPACNSERIRPYGAGTEKVEAEVVNLFPLARTLRWDHETTQRKGSHEVILAHFAAHRADVLVGTQMLAKGLDLPLVTLVGVVLADVGLSLPDYRANERTFAVLAQVAGRAGRSPLGGEVILQTYLPEHPVIQAAARHDYPAFAREELVQRKRLGYPPFTRLARLEVRHADPRQAEAQAQELAARLRRKIEDEGRRAELIGPAPAFFGKVGGVVRWQIVVRSSDPAGLLRGLTLPGKADWRIQIDPVSLL